MERRTAAFIGHSDCAALDDRKLMDALTKTADEGYQIFLNGGMGQFDLKCARYVSELKRSYAGIQSILVILYLSFRGFPQGLFDDIIFPEELEGCRYKAAIPRRNRYLVDHSGLVLCYVNHDWGGAAKTYAYARRRGKRIVNLGTLRA